MTIVRETYVAPGGAPARVRHVSVVLAGEDGKPITGYVHAAGQTIVTSRRFALSPSGLISVDLVPNSLIEPSGTVWKRIVTFEDESRDVAYWIVPDVPGPVDAADIMADPPGAIDPPGLNLLVLQIASVDAKADAAHQELDDLHPVSRSGEYSDLENTPSFAPVAASGAYSDLTGRPVIEGTGSPVGVVSAPVGTLYRDTAGTNGAVLWVKQAGTGNTGWRVVQGDTGWRNVTGELLNGWTASIVRIRRTAEAVWWHVEGLDGTSSTDLAFLPNFPGFDSGLANLPRFLLHTTASAVRRGYRGATAMTMASDGASGSLYGTFSAVPAASTPWPTTLPGSA